MINTQLSPDQDLPDPDERYNRPPPKTKTPERDEE